MGVPLVAFAELQIPQIIMALVAAAGVAYGGWAARRSKREEVAQQAAATAIITPFTQLQSVADANAAGAVRERERADRAEARADAADARTDRIRLDCEVREAQQGKRCTTMLEVATKAITDMMDGKCGVEQAEDVLDAIQHHTDADHPNPTG